MVWEELSPEQRHEVKENYMIRLADEGRFIKTIYGDNADEPERGPSQGELYDADYLISDDEIKEECDGIEFVAEDFLCPSPSEQWRMMSEN
jgi:hypothetical protein